MTSDKVRSLVELLGQNLPEGQSAPNQICPVCNGGHTPGRTTFSVTNRGGTLYYCCFSASCSAGGSLTTAQSQRAGHRLKDKPTAKLNPWKGSLRSLSHEEIVYFKERFNISPLVARAGIRVTENNTYFMEVKGFYGGSIRRLGGVERLVPWPDSPTVPEYPFGEPPSKTKYWKEVDAPAVAYYLEPPTTRGHKVVVEEDQLSAMALQSHDVGAIALLGTTMDMKTAMHIQRLGLQPIVALDSDASRQAFKMVKRYGAAWDNPKVMLLEQDIKDTKDLTPILRVIQNA